MIGKGAKMERNCNKCVYHTSGECSKWECLGTVTKNDFANEKVRDFAKFLIDNGFDVVNLHAEWQRRAKQ